MTMASIISRKTKYAVVYWYLNESNIRKQKWDTLETKKEAQARKAFIEYYQKKNGYCLVPHEQEIIGYQKQVAEQSTTKEDEDITVREFLEVFVNLYGPSKWSVSTFSTKLSQIENYIYPLIGDLKLKELTTKKLTQYYHDLLSVPEVPRGNRKASGRMVQPALVKKIHDTLRCALNQAIRWEYLDTKMRNPASLATLPKRQKNKRKVWSIETFTEAIQVAEDELLLLAMQLAFSTSLRVGEITGLTWDNLVIDDESIKNNMARLSVKKELSRVYLSAMQKLQEKDIIRVFPVQKPHCKTRLVLKTPKTESSVRTVWLPQTVANLFRQYQKDQAELQEFLGDAYNDYNLVFALDNGNPVESRIIRDRLKLLCDEHGFERVDFHSLRHLSTKYKLKMTQGDIKSVQGDTGHTEAEMVTDVYAEIVDEDRRFNAQKLEEVFYHNLGKAKTSEISSTELSETEKQLIALIKKLPSELKESLLKDS